MSFFNKIKKLLFQIRLKLANPYKRADIIRKKCYHIGKNVKINTTFLGDELYLISIEDNVIIGGKAKFITHDGSRYVVTKYLNIPRNSVDAMGGAIKLKENCFIGAYSILLPGTEVGKNSIVAAGSVVKGKIPDNQIWGGVPAKFIMDLDKYSEKVMKSSKTYPWKYDKDGHLLHLSPKEQIPLKQKFFFES